MSANDELDPPISSADLGSAIEPASAAVSAPEADAADGNRLSMAEPINLLPPKLENTIQVNVVAGNCITPSPHHGNWDDGEELEPIDVHALNVVPWKIQFSVPGTVVQGEPWQPLPYPDPLEGLDDEGSD